MAIAGRVAIVPKGEYSNAVTYDKLDLVMYNNDAYIAKKASTGIEPTNDEYWMLILNNVVAEDLEKIIDGTTTVGNANKLGGKGASEYALGNDVTKRMGWNAVSTSILDLAVSLPSDKNGVYHYYLNSYTGGDLGNANHSYDNATVLVRYGSRIVILWGNDSIKRVAMNYYTGSTWTGWQELATTADLANYLPLSGGELSNANGTPLYIKGGSVYSYISFKNSEGTRLGRIGFEGVGKPVFYEEGYKDHYLLHTGNKPTGSYAGNGSSEKRTISVGGSGKEVLYIYNWDSQAGALVWQYGAIVFKRDSIGHIPVEQCSFVDGNLILATSDERVNRSGTQMNYRVL